MFLETQTIHLASEAISCCVASYGIGRRLHMAFNIEENDVCTHGGSFVCDRQFLDIFCMSYSKEFQECPPNSIQLSIFLIETLVESFVALFGGDASSFNSVCWGRLL
jgi:hypothetical protein